MRWSARWVVPRRHERTEKARQGFCHGFLHRGRLKNLLELFVRAPAVHIDPVIYENMRPLPYSTRITHCTHVFQCSVG